MALRPLPITPRTTTETPMPVNTPVVPKATAPKILTPKQNLGMGSLEGVQSNMATRSNPIKVLTTPKPAQPDYNTMDLGGLQDELTRYKYRQQAGNFSEEDAVNFNRISRLIGEKTLAGNTQPIDTSAITKLEQDREAERLRREGLSTSALDAFKREQEALLAERTRQLNDSFGRQKESAQSATSFSGFGRSTFNADQQTKIEESKQNAILAARAAADMEIQKRQAELAGADAKVLELYDQQITQAKGKATQLEQEAIANAQKIKQEQSAIFGNTLKDIIANSGIKVDINDEKALEQIISISRNPNGSVNEEVLKSLPAAYQAIVRAGVQSGIGKQQIDRSKVKFQRIGGTTKAPIYGYIDPITGEVKQANQGQMMSLQSGGGGGIGRGGSGGGTAGAGVTGGTGNALDLVDYNVKFKNQDQSNAFSYATRMIEASDVFNQTEQDIAGLSKGQYILQKSYGKLPYGSALQSDTVQKQAQAEQNFINAVLRRESGAAIGANEYNSAEKQYFPQPGDSAAVLEQKRKNRLTALKGISAATGNQKALAGAINTISQGKKTAAPVNTPAPEAKPTTTTGAGRWVKK